MIPEAEEPELKMSHSAISIPVSLGQLWWATMLAFFLQATLVIVATSPDETTDYKLNDEDFQIEEEVAKRDWNRKLNEWGKRGWTNLHGGWALKRNVPTDLEEQNIYSAPFSVQKRSWQNFQNAWGKRVPPENKDLTLQEIGSTLNENEDPLPYEADIEPEILTSKRNNWSKFTDGWGKRNKWESFKGAWGKREPAWVHLKGLWGKRSRTNSYVN